jgi:hypothetical protein
MFKIVNCVFGKLFCFRMHQEILAARDQLHRQHALKHGEVHIPNPAQMLKQLP